MGSSSNSIRLKDLEKEWGFKNIVNVVTNYKWSTGTVVDIPPSHMPRIILREYEIANNALFGQITRAGAFSRIVGDNPYASLYTCTSTGRAFIFPYLTEEIWNSKITWEEVKAGGDEHKKKNGIVGGISKAIGWGADKIQGINHTVNQLLNSAPAEFENNGYEWRGGDVSDISTKFYLLNTNSTPEAWIKNYRLIQYLMVACMHDQMNTTKACPPPIYTMYVPGQRYSPAVAIQSLKIEQLGSVIPYPVIKGLSKTKMESKEPTTSQYDPEHEVIYIPDAWSIEIGFMELVQPSRQTHLFGMNSNRRRDFQAITPPGSSAPIDKCEYTNWEVGNSGFIIDYPYETQSGVKFDMEGYTKDLNFALKTSENVQGANQPKEATSDE